MNRFNEILNEMKPLIGSLVAEERARLLQLEEELKTLQLSEQDRKEGQKFFEDGINEIQNEIQVIKEKVSLQEQLKEVSEIISLSYIAKKYFNKTRTWLYQKINQNVIHGKACKFTDEELKTLQFALDDIKNKIGSIKVSY
jgi:hypothetical protein